MVVSMATAMVILQCLACPLTLEANNGYLRAKWAWFPMLKYYSLKNLQIKCGYFLHQQKLGKYSMSIPEI